MCHEGFQAFAEFCRVFLQLQQAQHEHHHGRCSNKNVLNLDGTISIDVDVALLSRSRKGGNSSCRIFQGRGMVLVHNWYFFPS